MTQPKTAYLERLLKLAQKYQLRSLRYDGIELEFQPSVSAAEPQPEAAEKPHQRREQLRALDELYTFPGGDDE